MKKYWIYRIDHGQMIKTDETIEAYSLDVAEAMVTSQKGPAYFCVPVEDPQGVSSYLA